MLAPDQIALICEYVGVAKGLDALRSTQADFNYANALALRCTVELPLPLWETVIKTVISPTWQSALELAAMMRADVHPADPLDFAKHAVFHAPGAGKK